MNRMVCIAAAALAAAAAAPTSAQECASETDTRTKTGQAAQDLAEGVAAMMAEIDAEAEGETATAYAFLDGEEPGNPLELTAEDIAFFACEEGAVSNYRAYPRREQIAWLVRLHSALAGGGTLDDAAEAIAGDTRIAPAAAREVSRLWLISSINGFRMRESDGEMVAEFRRQAFDALEAAGGHPTALAVLAEALDTVDECAQANFDGLLSRAAPGTDAAWIIAEAATCSRNYVRALQADPAHAVAPVYRLATYGSLSDVRSIPVLEWLASDAAVAAVAPADRASYRSGITARLLDQLFESGLTERALALYDGLPSEVQERIIASGAPVATDEKSRRSVETGRTITISGHSVVWKEFEPWSALTTHLAIALYNAGRVPEAEALLQSDIRLAESRKWAECRTDFERKTQCGDEPDSQTILLLDKQMHQPESDPYPLAEVIFGSGFPGSISQSGPVADLGCIVFAEPQYADICDSLRQSVARSATLDLDDYEAEESEPAFAAIRDLGLPGFAAIAAATDQRLAQARAAYGPLDDDNWQRERVDPVYPDFAVSRQPADAPRLANEGDDVEGPEWPDNFGDPPPAMWPLRWDVDGDRVTAIAISPIFDPAGEVSPGGYWVLLSENGGKSWADALYTGLSAYFPFVFDAASTMRLRDGDTIHLPVERALIDTSTITYPPIGTQTIDREGGLVLDLPLDRLRADSDNDGLTDLAEAHLLLDRPREGLDTPFVVGNYVPVTCEGPPDRQMLARAEMFAHIFQTSARAIVEPVDRPPSQIIGGWKRVPTAENLPLFIAGDPADFACLSIAQPVMVYSQDDIAELQRRTPDFRTIKLPRMVVNRAGTRGYVQWSAGWTGGTLLFLWEDGAWRVETISEWIT